MRLDGWTLEVGLEPMTVQAGPNVSEQSAFARVGFLFRPFPQIATYFQQAGLKVPALVRPPPPEGDPINAREAGTALAVSSSGALIPTPETHPDEFKKAVIAPGKAFYARPEPLPTPPVAFILALTPFEAMRLADRDMPPPPWFQVPEGWPGDVKPRAT